MPEDLPLQPQEEGHERSVAWELPASWSTKLSVGSAIDEAMHAVPRGGLRKRRQGGRKDLFFGSHDGLTKGVEFESDLYMADEDGKETQKMRARTVYEYHARPDHDPELLKTDWPGRVPDDEPLTVTEGEARQLLEKLEEIRRTK
jgi:hypothetical protein